MMRKSIITCCTLALAMLASQLPAHAFPDHPVRFIVPNPPGGSNDGAARTLGQALGEIWPHGIVIENRAGGGGNIGTQAAATSPADGYNYLLTSPGPLTINPSLYQKLPFDPRKDFVPIALVATVPIVLIVNPSLPAKNLRELIALAKQEGGKMNFASSGVGSTHHLAAELFNKLADVHMSHIPYRGAAPAMNDLIAGHVPILFDNLPTVIQHVQAGTVRALAIASPARAPSLPDVPTFAEAGLPGFEASSWFGLFAPAGTPPEIIASVTSDVQKTLARPEVQKKYQAMGSPVGDLTGKDFSAFLQKETDKWAEVVRVSGASIRE